MIILKYYLLFPNYFIVLTWSNPTGSSSTSNTACQLPNTPLGMAMAKHNMMRDPFLLMFIMKSITYHWKICEYGNQQTVIQARKQKPGTDYNLYDCIVALVKIVQNLHTYIWIQLDFLFMNLQYICQSTES